MHHNRHSLLTFLCVALALGGTGALAGLAYRSSSYSNELKEVTKYNVDSSYSSLCKATDPYNVDLTVIESESNILCPDICDFQIGSFSLKSGYLLKLRANATYSLKLYISDCLRLCQEKHVNISVAGITCAYIRTDSVGDQHSLSISSVVGTPTTFFSTVRNENGIRLSADGLLSEITMQFTVPADTDAKATQTFYLSQFSIDFNDAKTSGIVEKAQLYKGTDNKTYTDYTHEQCGLSGTVLGPYATGYSMRINVPYGDTTVTPDILKKSLLAYDKGDAKYTDIQLFRDDYSSHKTTLDTDLDIIFQAADSLSNISYFTYHMKVYDTVKPVISMNDADYKVSYTKTLTQDILLSNISVTDNYLEKAPTLSVLNFDYNNHPKLGKISYTVQGTDASHNNSTYTANVTLIDDIAPVITVGKQSLSAQAGTLLGPGALLDGFSANDEIDGACEVSLVNDNYTSNYNKVGTYTYDVLSQDAAGNTSRVTVYVEVKDTEGPIFYINKTYLTTFGNVRLDSDEAIKSLARTGAIPEKRYTSSEYIDGSYKDLEEVVPGIYDATIAAYADDGTIEYVKVTIEAKADEEEKKEATTPLERFKAFFADLWQNFLAFLSQTL